MKFVLSVKTVLELSNWRNRWLWLVLVIVVGLVFLSWFFSNSQQFPINTVTIQGDYVHESQRQLQRLITPFAQQSIYAIPIRKLHHQIQQLPWIAAAEVRRQFPDTLAIHLQDHLPCYRWNSSDLVSQRGQLFTPPKIPLETVANLPQLSAPTNDDLPLLLATINQLNQLFSSLQITVQYLHLSTRHAWSFQLSNGVKVVAGRKNLFARVKRLVTVYKKIISQAASQVDYVDLRYPNGLSVKWKGNS